MSLREDRGYTQVTPEDLLEAEGVEYRETSGSRGRQFNIKECPVCHGTDWKVYLAVETGYGNCFHGSCETRFNLWTFAKAVMGTQDSSIVGKRFDEIAKAAGWRPKRQPRVMAPALTSALKLPTSVPQPSPAGMLHPYLTERGFTPAICEQFGLRACLDGAFFYQDEEGEKRSMSFSGRILIPIYDLDGSLATFQGRDFTGESDRKYMFPKRLPATARYIFNGHRAVAEGWTHAVMGEGAFDVIAIQRAIDEDRNMRGIGAVGSFGKSLTLDIEPGMPTQLQALIELKKRGLKIITILWDGESKALASACKAARRLVGYGFSVRIAFMPKGKDPAEVSPSVVRKAIESARPYNRALDVKIKLRNPY